MSNSKSKTELLKGIRGGKGIQYILDKAHEILGNPFVIHNMEYKLVARSDGIPYDDPFCMEFIENGMLSKDLIDFCMTESFIDSVSNSTEQDGIVYLISDQLKYDRVFGQLYNKNKMPVADLITLNSGTPFDADTPAHVRIICDKLSKELGKDEYYQQYGQAYQESILKMLIERGIEDKAIYAAHVANIDAGLGRYIFTAVVQIPRYGGDYAGLSSLRDTLRQVKPAYKYYVYKDQVVILISSNEPALNVKKAFSKLLSVFAQKNIYVGVSSAFENLFEIPDYYSEALEALTVGSKGRPEQDSNNRIFLYGEIKK